MFLKVGVLQISCNLWNRNMMGKELKVWKWLKGLSLKVVVVCNSPGLQVLTHHAVGKHAQEGFRNQSMCVVRDAFFCFPGFHQKKRKSNTPFIQNPKGDYGIRGVYCIYWKTWSYFHVWRIFTNYSRSDTLHGNIYYIFSCFKMSWQLRNHNYHNTCKKITTLRLLFKHYLC